MISNISFENVESEIDKYDEVETKCIAGYHSKIDPFFSIIIPTFERDNTLFQALDSAVKQQFNDYEIVILENGCSSKSKNIKEYISSLNCDKIIYYQNAINIGVVGNFNRATKIAHGKYIVMLHDDDILSPFALKMIFQVICKHISLACIGLKSISFSSEFEVEQFEIPHKRIKCRRVGLEEIYFNRSILLSGMSFQRDIMLKLGGFKESQGIIADNALIMDFAKNGGVVEIMVPAIAYRISDNESMKNETFESILYELPQMWKYLSETNIITKIDYRNFFELRKYQYIQGALKFWKKEEERDFYLDEQNKKKYDKNTVLRLIQKIWKLLISFRQKYYYC